MYANKGMHKNAGIHIMHNYASLNHFRYFSYNKFFSAKNQPISINHLIISLYIPEKVLYSRVTKKNRVKYSNKEETHETWL